MLTVKYSRHNHRFETAKVLFCLVDRQGRILMASDSRGTAVKKMEALSDKRVSMRVVGQDDQFWSMALAMFKLSANSSLFSRN